MLWTLALKKIDCLKKSTIYPAGAVDNELRVEEGNVERL